MIELTGKAAAKWDARLRAVFGRKGWTVFGGAWNVTAFGLRSAVKECDAFDDVLGMRAEDSTGAVRLWLAPATTDPGRTYLESPMRADGTAVLGEGKHSGLWVPGYHKGRPALVSTRVTFGWRDANRDRIVDRTGKRYDNLAGIYLHGTRDRDGGKVGPFSAGCQVTDEQADAEQFVELVVRQERAGHGRSCSYHLLHVDDAPELAPLLGMV